MQTNIALFQSFELKTTVSEDYRKLAKIVKAHWTIGQNSLCYKSALTGFDHNLARSSI
jgi:hypothetical protein